MPGHLRVKLLKTNSREIILKGFRERQRVTEKATVIQITGFRDNGGQKTTGQHLGGPKERKKKSSPEFYIHEKKSIKYEGKIQIFQVKDD